jgi:two-component system, LytTR family, sensor kinase
VSATQPLRLRIHAIGNGQLEVSNDLQKKLQTEQSSGFGLNSIIERYKLLGSANVLVNDQHGYFSVTLPLLDPLPA